MELNEYFKNKKEIVEMTAINHSALTREIVDSLNDRLCRLNDLHNASVLDKLENTRGLYDYVLKNKKLTVRAIRDALYNNKELVLMLRAELDFINFIIQDLERIENKPIN